MLIIYSWIIYYLLYKYIEYVIEHCKSCLCIVDVKVEQVKIIFMLCIGSELHRTF